MSERQWGCGVPILSDDELDAYLATVPDVVLTAPMTAEIRKMRNEVEGKIADILGYSIAQATYTEYYPRSTFPSQVNGDALNVGRIQVTNQIGNLESGQVWKGQLSLLALPVRSIQSVNENPNAWTTGVTDGDWPASTLLAATAYRLDMAKPGFSKSGILVRNFGHWPNELGVIRVSYTAGYTDGEIDVLFPQIKRAVKIAIEFNYLNALVHLQAFATQGQQENTFQVTDFYTSYANTNDAGYGGFNKFESIIPTEALGLIGTSVNLSRYL